MAKLTAAKRKRIPTSSFAGPDRSYPINDASHARNALSRVSQHGTSELKARVRAAVHRKFPGIGRQEHASGGACVEGKRSKHRLDRKGA
jgi:hypothetical protein